MTQPLVSIVLPVYNGSRYLNEAVQSCISQIYTNWELVIVDDASTDSTPQRIAGFLSTDARIRSTRHTTNRRLPCALNTGFGLARGQYFTWISDDNSYRPAALAEMVAVLESHPQVDVVYADYSEIDEHSQLVRRVSVGLPESLSYHNCIGPCFLYRRRLMELVGGYSEDLFLAEDYDFWLRAAACCRMEPLHTDLYCYRRHNNSLTDAHVYATWAATEEALNRNFLRLRPDDNRHQAATLMRLVNIYCARRDFAKARTQLLRAIRLCPTVAAHRITGGQLAALLFGGKAADALRFLLKKSSRRPEHRDPI